MSRYTNVILINFADLSHVSGSRSGVELHILMFTFFTPVILNNGARFSRGCETFLINNKIKNRASFNQKLSNRRYTLPTM